MILGDGMAGEAAHRSIRELIMNTIGRRMALVAATTIIAMATTAAPSCAQSVLPQDIQSRLDASDLGGDQQLFTAIQSLITANPALAAPIAGLAASHRNKLAASIAVTAAGVQPSQAAAIAAAVTAAVPSSAVAVFNALAGLAPDQAGAIAGAVTEAVPPSTEAVIAALQLVQTASGGNSDGAPPAGQQQAQGETGGNSENPNQTPGAINLLTPSTS